MKKRNEENNQRKECKQVIQKQIETKLDLVQENVFNLQTKLNALDNRARGIRCEAVRENEPKFQSGHRPEEIIGNHRRMPELLRWPTFDTIRPLCSEDNDVPEETEGYTMVNKAVRDCMRVNDAVRGFS